MQGSSIFYLISQEERVEHIEYVFADFDREAGVSTGLSTIIVHSKRAEYE